MSLKPSYPSKLQLHDSCSQCAKAISELLESMGASIKLTSDSDECNPVITGRINTSASTEGSVTIYGNYDINCRDANASGWKSYPFELTAIDGNFYGCGVSESKGPLVSVIQAVRELIIDGSLSVNVNFVIGENLGMSVILVCTSQPLLDVILFGLESRRRTRTR